MSATGAADRLAIDGGVPVRRTPLPPWPYYSEDEIQACTDVLRSAKVNYWTGESGHVFEREFAEACGASYGIALANGSVALELALYALGIGPGDEVIVTSRSFVASASCVAIRGARPVFADVDADSQNITAATVAPWVTPRTKAIVAVHLAGWPCDMDALMALANEHGLKVIEDCAQATGAKYRGQSVGSLGHVAAFSFCQDKILSTGGEGGMLTTNDRDLWQSAWAYKDHGKSYDAAHAHSPKPGFRWLHDSIGTNWRLTELQAAIGRIQLRKLPDWLRLRRRNAAILAEAFRTIPGLRIASPPADIEHAYYKLYAFIEPSRLKSGWDRERIIRAINAEGVPCDTGGCSEIYLEKAFAADLQPARRLPVASRLGETSLMFLVHPTLGEEDMDDMCCAVRKVFQEATR